MTMRSWIRRFFTRPAGHTVRRTPRRFRLALEALEDRCVPSTSTLHSLLHEWHPGPGECDRKT